MRSILSENLIRLASVCPASLYVVGGSVRDVLLGKAPGRESREDITMFDSSGIGLQDLIVAALVTQRAKERGLGTVIEL